VLRASAAFPIILSFWSACVLSAHLCHSVSVRKLRPSGFALSLAAPTAVCQFVSLSWHPPPRQRLRAERDRRLRLLVRQAALAPAAGAAPRLRSAPLARVNLTSEALQEPFVCGGGVRVRP
jgi:hypothetical protein